MRLSVFVGKAALPAVGALAIGFGGVGCGNGDLSEQSAYVLHGDAVAADEYPAVGALLDRGLPYCTGILLAPDVVLSAGHCLTDSVLGERVPSFTTAPHAVDPAAAAFPGVDRHVHPDFSLFENAGSGQPWNDLGVLILAEPIDDAFLVEFATDEELWQSVQPGNVATVVGYGITDQSGSEPGMKHVGQVSVLGVADEEFWAGTPSEQDACAGDSGGPASITQEDGSRRVVGLVSRVPGERRLCEDGAIFTRIDAYRPWINTWRFATSAVGPGEELPRGAGGCAEVSSGRRSAATMWVVCAALLLLRRRNRRSENPAEWV